MAKQTTTKKFGLLAILLGLILALTAVFSVDAMAAETSKDTTTSKGIYVYESKDTVLARINAIRKEACEEGLPDPRDPSKKLTASDYKPVKWSASLEKTAQANAASGKDETTVNSLDNVLTAAVNAVYSDKADWADTTKADDYAALINPDNQSVALAAYSTDDKTANVATEVSTAASDGESQVVTKDTAADTKTADTNTTDKKTTVEKRTTTTTTTTEQPSESSKSTTSSSSEATAKTTKTTAYITVYTKPDKTSYTTGDKLDLSGGSVLVHYTDGSTQVLSMRASGVTVTPNTLNLQGSTTVIVIYDGCTTSFDVNVTAREAKGIQVSEKTVTLKVGQTKTISATVLPAKAYDRRVFWKTDDANTAALNAADQTTMTKVHDFLFGPSEDQTSAQSAGSTTITGMAAGTTSVTAITDNGNTATIKVIVKK